MNREWIAWLHNWRQPEMLLYVMAATSTLGFAVWHALLNNFAIERAGFTGLEMGILQSLREVPGFLAFSVVFLLLVVREQPLALISLLLLGIGTALTGFFPTVLGLYCTTVLMSIGFHYYETVQSSLALQWIEVKKTPETLGRLIAVRSFTSIVTFGLIWLSFDFLSMEFHWVYLLGGGFAAAMAFFCWAGFPQFPQKVVQNKHMVLRTRYWLYYALTFMSGARRQIFVVFAGFLMVEKFGYSVGAISILFLVNAAINVWLAPRIGRLIGRWGERKALIFEYLGLIGIFTAYAFVENATVAAGLYIADHVFFALAIAIKTYFQKISDPADIASTAGVSFTISHIAAVVIPAAFGALWLVSPAAVFLSGTAMAAVSLVMACNVPRQPAPGNEVLVGRGRQAPAAAE
ncbi:MAG: MFS transporter [Alphaproteobacteria bacterium]|nr:MFS transporter [Alphaproteobacteria bacterium]